MLYTCKRFIKIFILTFACNATALSLDVPLITSKSQLVQLDSRDSYNSYSIYLQVGGSEVVLYEQVDSINFDKIHIMMAIKLNDGAYSQTKLKVENQEVTKNYFTLVGYEQHSNKTWIYVSLSSGYKKPATIYKARLSLDGSLHDLNEVPIEEKLIGRSPAKLRKLNNQSNAIAYRKEKCCHLGLLLGSDSGTYNLHQAYNQIGVMPVIAGFANGKLIYTYQRSYPIGSTEKPQYVPKSRLRIYFDKNWSSELFVSEMVPEVHDTYPFERLDGKIDLYYSHGGQRTDGQLSLWRRCIDGDGNLGSEQLIVGKEIGNIAKAYPYRKKNGAIALMFIEQGKDINQQGAIQFIGEIAHDATCDLINHPAPATNF